MEKNKTITKHRKTAERNLAQHIGNPKGKSTERRTRSREKKKQQKIGWYAATLNQDSEGEHSNKIGKPGGQGRK